jgi:hypothetical protein
MLLKINIQVAGQCRAELSAMQVLCAQLDHVISKLIPVLCPGLLFSSSFPAAMPQVY